MQVHPNTARSFFKLKKEKKNKEKPNEIRNLPIKEIVLAHVDQLGLDPHGFLPPLNDDIADSYVMARYIYVTSWIQKEGCSMPELQGPFYEAYLKRNTTRLEKKFETVSNAVRTRKINQAAHVAYLDAFNHWMQTN